ncbi:hypothetical protein K0M31_002234 [Melipona bicolor]|uniref:Uncharacterized protein n=1 Tax=Melipona bicolor TaxID=60889 RepID=A0AA40GI78_9HYME|nr:hypothetical protein K0M31_002234 [Melipona bicolor]
MGKDRKEGPHLMHKIKELVKKNWPYTSFKLQAGIPLYQWQHSPQPKRMLSQQETPA